MIIYVILGWLTAAGISLPPLLDMRSEHTTETGAIMCTVFQNSYCQSYATFGSLYVPLIVMFQHGKENISTDKGSTAPNRISNIAEHSIEQRRAVPCSRSPNGKATKLCTAAAHGRAQLTAAENSRETNSTEKHRLPLVRTALHIIAPPDSIVTSSNATSAERGIVQHSIVLHIKQQNAGKYRKAHIRNAQGSSAPNRTATVADRSRGQELPTVRRITQNTEYSGRQQCAAETIRGQRSGRHHYIKEISCAWDSMRNRWVSRRLIELIEDLVECLKD
ncbi:5-hydroxytryptamine receptor 1 [Eufriesea mexicana]|nr:5-hydroxytryptamine receptor 1 [Eufriesea mexicana]